VENAVQGMIRVLPLAICTAESFIGTPLVPPSDHTLHVDDNPSAIILYPDKPKKKRETKQNKKNHTKWELLLPT
jgi:hypothetical protein